MSTADHRALERFTEMDAELVGLAKGIRVLSVLAWPKETERSFLESYAAGNPKLPAVTLVPRDHGAKIEALHAFLRRCDREHPVGDYLYRTAFSYVVAATMMQNLGTPRFTECSVFLYGRPDALSPTQTHTVLDAAIDFERMIREMLGEYRVPETAFDIPAEAFARDLKKRVGPFFGKAKVTVRLDATLAAKAVAGSRGVKLRADAVFSTLDLEQLTQHEAFIHTATMLNGKRQPHLKTMGLGAPRTTRPQEGLATFAELVTLALDVMRLRRLALRCIAVKRALDGDDFIQIFRFFLEAGQTPAEAYKCSERIFRGGDVGGKIVFTKDAAYLAGLFRIQLFLRKAMQENRPELAEYLFAGRVTTVDVLLLAPFFESGYVARAELVPHWARDLRCLAAYMTFASAMGNLRLDNIHLDMFAETEDDAMAGWRMENA